MSQTFNSEKKNGRFSGINEDDFESEKRVAVAVDNETGRKVVVKAIFPQRTKELEYARREARTLAQLEHENVVKFVDFLEGEKLKDVLGHVCFLVTDFCSGGTLIEFIEKKREARQRTRADEARIIAAQLVSALSFCHDQTPAIVHQDIKPANVFVMDDFITIKLGDFGSAATIKSATKSMTASGVKYTLKYGAPEMFNSDTVKQSAQLDVWGFALVLQEVLTLEHAFGRVCGRAAGLLEIPVNIKNHENPRSTRTRLVHVFGQAHEFSDFDTLLEKCTRADRSRRPKNAIELRNEDVFSVFRCRLENGERACDIVPPPFEDQKDRQIRLLNEELAEKTRKNADLENRLNSEATSMRQKDAIIETQNQENFQLKTENSQLKNEIEKLKNEAAKIRPIFAKMESELNEARNLIQQLTTEHESEKEQLKKETRKAEEKIRALESSLKNENEQKRNEAGNQGRVVEKKEIERKNGELEKMGNELGELGGAGHFWGNDKMKSEGGVRAGMHEEEIKKVLRLLAAGETKINLKEREFRAFLSEKKRRETQKKFCADQNWNVAEAGWTIKFKTALKYWGGDGKYFHLWLDQKAGRAKFKATAQQINGVTGEEKNRRELQSKTDGTRQRIKYEYDPYVGGFVRFNITFL